MRQALHRRLQQLEVESAQARLSDRRDRGSDLEATISKCRLFLRIRDVEQGPMESLMEALARALEISPRELRAQLLSDIDPIHKYFTDHGVYEEIERRKAAGMWPGGGKGKRECQDLTE
jgi:hypothetical protein